MEEQNQPSENPIQQSAPETSALQQASAPPLTLEQRLAILEQNQQAIVSAVNNSMAAMFNDLCACLGIVIARAPDGKVAYQVPQPKNPGEGGLFVKVFTQMQNIQKLIEDKPAIYLPGGRN